MRTQYYIHLRDLQDATRPLSYARAPLDSLREVQLGQALLRDFLPLVTGNRLVVFVPGGDVRLASVDVPARQPSKVLQAAPYLLEEQLADDVETQHFALGPRQGDGSTPVAVVSRERISTWMGKLAAEGLTPDALVPDLLALPHEPRVARWCALLDGDQVLVRSGAWSGFCASRDDLPAMLTLADGERRHTLRMLISDIDASDLTTIDWPLEPMPGYRSSLDALARSYQATQAINLLQGVWAPRSDLARHLKPWKPAAVAAGLWLAVGALVYGIETWTLSSELESLQQANTARFQQLFPTETRVFDLSSQVTQQITMLEGSGGQRDAFALLTTTAQALQANPGLRVESLQFREGSLFLALTGNDLQVLEALRAWFAQQPGRVLEVQSANAGTEGVQIRLRVGAA